MLDQTDIEILTLLKENSRLQRREIGELVHLTGQAVANRIKKMEQAGIIQGYTIKINPSSLGKIAFITVFMRTLDHPAFINFVNANESILNCDRISGDGCYLLKVNFIDDDDLMGLLSKLLEFGNYRINISIGKVK